MIEFMVIGAPRCGTTWAANWLTTDASLCLHDPLFKHHYDDLDKIESSKMLGVSCTGLYMFTDWLNKHPARKIVLHRDFAAINLSLKELGLDGITPSMYECLDKVEGRHVEWQDIFSNPRPIYEYLLQKPFDEERHKELCAMSIQPQFDKLTVNMADNRRMMAELLDKFKGRES